MQNAIQTWLMYTHDRKQRKIRGSQSRSGVVVVEFAICAPLLFMFFFASLEFSRVNMIRQSIENAVYEGARRGIVPGATADNCRASALTVLNSISASGATIRGTPAANTQD